MGIQGAQPSPDEGNRCRYLVVGAGSAGAVLAGRLTEDPAIEVLLLEAGPDYRSSAAPAEMRSGHWVAILDTDRFPQFQWTELTARRTPGRSPEPYWRGKGLGGSSAINGQVAIRPPLDDFSAWIDAGGAHWAPDQVLSSFIRLEDDLLYGDRPWHGRSGPIPISRAPVNEWGALDAAFHDAFASLGNGWSDDCNEPGTTGISVFPFNARDGERVSASDGYLDPVRHRANLHILGDALVDRVVFDGDRAIGVVASIGGRETIIHADEILLAAGAVHSPAILQRSGVGPAAHLRSLGIPVIADLPAGDGFQEHPHVYFGFGVPLDLTPPKNGRHTNACVRWSSGMAGTASNDMMAIVNGPAPGLAGFAGLGLWVNQPFSRGALRITSRDPHVDPGINMNLTADARDVARLRHAVDTAADALAHPAFAALRTSDPAGIDGTPLSRLAGSGALDDWIEKVVDGSAHASSTCALGAVVDGECRVIGTSGLRVIDLSITPCVPRANTNLTAMMLGEHMAARLAGSPDARRSAGRG